MIPRDYRATGAALAADINRQIAAHPDSFECLIYRAILTSAETVAANEDVVGSMETSERTLAYADAVPARAMRVIEGPFFASMANAGDVPDGNLEQPLILITDQDDVPEQSVIQYEELVSDTDRRLVSLYVLKNDLVASAPGAKTRHYCMPFHGDDGLLPSEEAP